MKALLGRKLAGVLEPVRDLVVGRLLQEIAQALERGARVRHEPAIRGADGRILRRGELHLPQRGDLAVTESGQTLMRNVESHEMLDFSPITFDDVDGFLAVIAPFRWDAAPVCAELDGGALDPTPLRRWYLEAFQSRYGELAPDLDGAVHSLGGPRQRGRACEFQCDLGSAPVDAFAEMLAAFAQAGAKTLWVGSDQEISEQADRA